MIYPSDLTDEQWEAIKRHFNTGNYGKSRKHEKRVLINAVFYLIKTGCQWRFLPKEYPSWKTVYSFFMRAKMKEIWEIVMDECVAISRVKMGKLKDPTYSLIDSQSVKTTGQAQERGIDGGKKNKRSKEAYCN
jgi:transposase